MRSRIAGALQAWCGIAREESACRCHRRLARARALGRVSGAPPAATLDLAALRERVRRMDALRAATAYYRADGALRPGRDLARRVRELVDAPSPDGAREA